MDWESFSDKLGTIGERVGRGLKGLFGSENERFLRTLSPLLTEIAGFALAGLGNYIAAKRAQDKAVSAILRARHAARIAIFTTGNALGSFVAGFAFQGLVGAIAAKRSVAVAPGAVLGTYGARHVAVWTIFGCCVSIIARLAFEYVDNSIAAGGTR